MSKGKRTGTLRERPITKRPTQRQKEPTPEELDRIRLKTEAAKALGLLDKVKRVGWGGLTAAETGRIGGFVTRIKRAQVGHESPDNSG